MHACDERNFEEGRKSCGRSRIQFPGPLSLSFSVHLQFAFPLSFFSVPFLSFGWTKACRLLVLPRGRKPVYVFTLDAFIRSLFCYASLSR